MLGVMTVSGTILTLSTLHNQRRLSLHLQNLFLHVKFSVSTSLNFVLLYYLTNIRMPVYGLWNQRLWTTIYMSLIVGQS